MINLNDNNFVFVIACLVIFLLFASQNYHFGFEFTWLFGLIALVFGLNYVLSGFSKDNPANWSFGLLVVLLVPLMFFSGSSSNNGAGNIFGLLLAGLSIQTFNIFNSLVVLLIFFLLMKVASNTSTKPLGFSLSSIVVLGVFIFAFVWPGINAFTDFWSLAQNTLIFQVVFLGLILLIVLHFSEFFKKNKIDLKSISGNSNLFAVFFFGLIIWPGVTPLQDVFFGIFSNTILLQLLLIGFAAYIAMYFLKPKKK